MTRDAGMSYALLVYYISLSKVFKEEKQIWQTNLSK